MGGGVGKKKKKKKKTNKKKNILYLGRLEKRKGIEYLIDAYRLVQNKHPEVILKIAGSGVKRKSLEKYVQQNSISGVEFLGYVAEEDKPLLMEDATVYCSPAPYGESFGIVLLEAMAVGTPVVAGNNVGYASVMKDTGMLSLVNPTSTVDFAQRLELMLFDEKVRKIWKEWAKDTVKQYKFSKIADAYEAVYEKALSIVHV